MKTGSQAPLLTAKQFSRRLISTEKQETSRPNEKHAKTARLKNLLSLIRVAGRVKVPARQQV